MRLFAAVWPPEVVLDHLDLALATVRGTTAGEDRGPVRWSARETWHLTVAFYGTVPDGSVPTLVDELAEVADVSVPYTLRLRGAGVFAHRTLWAGVAGEVEAHRALTSACVGAGEVVGARPDDRVRDRPHLTVGRVRAGGGPRGRGRPDRWARRVDEGVGQAETMVAAMVGALAVYEGPAWTVGSLRVVRSEPGAGRGGGPLYTPIEELGFGG